MIKNLLGLASGIGLPPKSYEAAIRARNLLSAFACDATGHYHLGGFAGLLFGVAASFVASQSRTIGETALTNSSLNTRSVVAARPLNSTSQLAWSRLKMFVMYR